MPENPEISQEELTHESRVARKLLKTMLRNNMIHLNDMDNEQLDSYENEIPIFQDEMQLVRKLADEIREEENG